MRKISTSDWKDVANSYFEKSMSLAVLFALFAFLVSPKIEVKPYEASTKVEQEAIDLPDFKEEIKPPEPVVKQVVQVIIDDDFDMEDEDEDIEVIDTIADTNIDMTEEEAPPVEEGLGKTPEFVFYEDAPKPIKTVRPKYPEKAKKFGITGEVLLDIEVFATGKVGAVKVVKSLEPSLDQAAIDAVKKWEFDPAKADGKPVSVWVQMPIEFALEN